MKVVEFYRGERGNVMGHTLAEIMQYSLGAMEMDHDYIQWILPSNETSAMNGDAPTLTKEEAIILSEDPELRERVKASFLKFIDFLGLELTGTEGEPVVDSLLSTQERPNPTRWMDHFNHNMLRVTRCLKCMRLTGHENYALALFEFLKQNQSTFSINTFGHWSKATFDDLWSRTC